MRKFTLVIEKGAQEYIGHVIELPGCHTQGVTIDELMANAREAIELYLEVAGDTAVPLEVVDIRTIEV